MEKVKKINIGINDAPVEWVFNRAVDEITDRLRHYGWAEKDIEKEVKKLARNYFK
ncbi:MAG: hypothetical protein Unbinned4512contig1001_3 [Prokaryotic dsDNA virus sp.]|nr:MAG: hypothetical protein Unbinned4512contig1001_3 [Prokaryotic dsDNA virus sp.]